MGQDLIRSAELNSAISESNQFKTAINTFKLKYNAVPGDMDNAQAYWPSCLDGSFGNTCNGSGNDKVEADPNNFHEGFRLFEHLSRAGLINGSYDFSPLGVMGGYKGFRTLSFEYLPRSKYNESLWIAGEFEVFSGADLVLNGTQALALFRSTGPALNPPDAHRIDSKIDDGIPLSGIVFGVDWYGSCISAGEYRLNRSSLDCAMIFEF